MTTTIINNQTFYESEDVEGEFILLPKKEPVYKRSVQKFIEDKVKKINQMKKKELVKLYDEHPVILNNNYAYWGGGWDTDNAKNFCIQKLKVRYFTKLLIEEYSLQQDLIEREIFDFLILNKGNFHKFNPFTRNPVTKWVDKPWNNVSFPEFLLEDKWDHFRSEKFKFMPKDDHNLYPNFD
jgi:hypothetical protein